jgi:hypothetical protein
MRILLSVLTCGVLLVAAVGCPPELPPDSLFACTANEDCGGGGWVCLARPDQPSVCCLPSTAEVCNGKDDNCNGTVDEVSTESCYGGPAGTLGVGACKEGVVGCAPDGSSACTGDVRPQAERCNGVDDDCDGSTDEDFNLQTDSAHCGQCNRACASTEACTSGTCRRRAEQLCSDGLDNDGDGDPDCADLDCDNQACGLGCTCLNRRKAETACSDGADNDGDPQIDCADDDCNARSCGGGCECRTPRRTEIGCANGLDDDGDNETDCRDTDCGNRSCGSGCRCDPNSRTPEERNYTNPTELGCCDGVDNDRDTNIDCADFSCGSATCAAQGFQCNYPGRREITCNDLQDNDGDNQIDCADRTDCPANTACRRTNGNPGTCNNSGQCQ